MPGFRGNVMTEYFNTERGFLAAMGVFMVAAGENLLVHKAPLLGADAESASGAKRIVASLLFGAGWLLVALSTFYRHSNSAMGILGKAGANVYVALASGAAIVAGTLMARAERDADPTRERVSGVSQALFLFGWAGITLSAATSSLSPFRMAEASKIGIVLLGVVTALAGAFADRSYEFEDAVDYAGGNYESSQVAAMRWPKWIYVVGLGVLALGIAHH